MADAMREKVAQALLEIGGVRYVRWWKEKFGDCTDDDPWPTWEQCINKDELREDARAALEACHFEELVTALTDMKTRFERCLVLNGTDQQYADMATKDAGDVLAKVEASDA